MTRSGITPGSRRSLVPVLTAALAAVTALTALAPLASAAPAAAPGHRRAAPPPGRLLTYGYGNARDGVGPRTPSLARLRRAWTDSSKVIAGGIYGQPLVDGRLVIVATENDKVYGLNAATGKIAWRYSVGAPARVAIIDKTPTLAPGCGDINPLGITGTPVIDAAAHEVLVAAEVQDHPGRPRWQNIRHVMVALKFTATSVRRAWQRPIDPPGARRHAYYIPAEQQRSALTLSRGRVYTEFGGLFGDCGKYQGYVVSVAASGRGRLRSWRVPTVREGAIWATDGAATNARGELFVATGNSNNDSGRFDYGDAVIGLSPGLRIDGYFAPRDWARRNADDLDLGSGGPILLPGSRLVFESGKPAVSGVSTGFLLSQSRLGRVGHPRFSGTVCPGGGYVFGAEAAERLRKGGPVYLYVPCSGGTVALRVSYGLHPRFTRAWAAHGPNGTPIIAGGLVWALATGADGGGGPSDLYGMRPLTGRVVVREQVRPVEHFATPGAGDGMIFVATAAGVQAFKPAN
jgi:hypothetical protein